MNIVYKKVRAARLSKSSCINIAIPVFSTSDLVSTADCSVAPELVESTRWSPLLKYKLD